MAHTRKRHAKELYLKHLAFSPIVGVFGHRQVGKSTFLSSEPGEYHTLDDEEQLARAHTSAKLFVATKTKLPFIIDECQQEPKLFPALKEWVRTHKKPGQFVLSGSVRFTSRKAIRESLAGRMSFFELLPFSVSEIRKEPLPDSLPKLLSHREFSSSSLLHLRPQKALAQLKKDFEIYLNHGGLPGLCFIREKQHRIHSLNFLHNLIIDRDIRMIFATKLSAATIKAFLKWLAKNSGNRYNASEAKRALGLASQTQRSLLYAMESVFLIRRIPIQGQKGETILLEDQFEELELSEEKLPLERQLEGALYRNLRTQLNYRLGEQFSFETYHTRDDARVPIVVRTPESVLGIIITEGNEPSLSEKRSAASFLGKFSQSKIIYASTQIIKSEVIHERALLVSIYSLL